MSLGNFALFCSHAAGLGSHFQHLLLVLLVKCNYLESHTLCSPYCSWMQHYTRCTLNLKYTYVNICLSTRQDCFEFWNIIIYISTDICLNSSSSVANSSPENRKEGHRFYRTISKKPHIIIWIIRVIFTPPISFLPVYVSLSSTSQQWL